MKMTAENKCLTLMAVLLLGLFAMLVFIETRSVYKGDNIEIKDNVVVLPSRVKFVSVTPEGYMVVREARKDEWCEAVYHIFNPSGKRVTRIEERDE